MVRADLEKYNKRLKKYLDESRFYHTQGVRYTAVAMAMAHGREDDVIDPQAAERFAAQYQIPVTWFPKEGHSLSNDPDTPDRVVDLAISLYRA